MIMQQWDLCTYELYHLICMAISASILSPFIHYFQEMLGLYRKLLNIQSKEREKSNYVDAAKVWFPLLELFLLQSLQERVQHYIDYIETPHKVWIFLNLRSWFAIEALRKTKCANKKNCLHSFSYKTNFRKSLCFYFYKLETLGFRLS